MTDQQTKTETFRKLHVPGHPLVLFNVWDAGSAKVVEQSGAKALATSSWAVADAYGFEDGERIPLSLALENLKRIVGVTALPVTLDLESGYGDTPGLVAKTVALAIEGGAVGCNLEDSYLSDGRLRASADQSLRIRAAREAAHFNNAQFFINARTDVFFRTRSEAHDETMLRDAVARARSYANAGADGLFVPGLKNLALIAELVKASPLPVNVYNGDGSLQLSALAARGVARVSFGGLPYANAMQLLKEAAQVVVADAGDGAAER
jgi:methylisocitrate lyase